MQVIEDKTQKSVMTPHQKAIFDEVVFLVESKVGVALKSNYIGDYMASIQGPAGTGKTFLTTQLAKYFKEKMDSDFEFIITSPTHKATSVIREMLYENGISANCKTIHSFLGIKPFRDYDKGIETFKIDKSASKDKTSILFVDESSMVSSELFEYIVEALSDGRVNFIIFIGDPYQLLPVGNNENIIYTLANQFILKEVVRQAKESKILSLATELRKALEFKNYKPLEQLIQQYDGNEIECFHNHNDFNKDFFKDNEWYNEDKVVAAYMNKNVDAFNFNIRKTYWAQKGEMNPRTFMKDDKVRFKEAYSVQDTIIYHNSQVVVLESAVLKYHDVLEVWFWECKAVDTSDQQIFRIIDEASKSVFNDKLEVLAQRAKRLLGKDRNKAWEVFYKTKDMFASVQYTYASTIHKLQGSTYESVSIDAFSIINSPKLSIEEKYRLLYVAITRAKYRVKIFLSQVKTKNLNLKDVNTKDVLANLDSELANIFY